MRPYGRKNPLPFPYSLSSANFAVLSQKETGFKRVETLVSILLPTAVGTANSCAPQSATLHLIKTQKNPAEKTSAGFIMLFQQAFCAILRLGSVQILQALQVSVTLGRLYLGTLEQALCTIRECTGQCGVTNAVRRLPRPLRQEDR